MKIIETENLFQSQFVNLNATKFADRDGDEKFWVWAQRPNDQRAVMIVPYINFGFKPFSAKPPAGYQKDMRIVLTKEFRVPLNDYEFGFPAGLIGGDEEIVDAATRELFEETNLKIEKIIQVSPFVYNTAGLSDESIAMVFCEASGLPSNKNSEASEDIKVIIATPDNVHEIISNPANKIAAKAWLILNQFVSQKNVS